MVDEVGKAPPSPWIPVSDPVELAILGKMLEELGELTSIVSRCLIQGIDGVEPETGKLNRDQLIKELGDVAACRKALTIFYGLDQIKILDRSDAKFQYQAAWHQMLRDLQQESTSATSRSDDFIVPTPTVGAAPSLPKDVELVPVGTKLTIRLDTDYHYTHWNIVDFNNQILGTALIGEPLTITKMGVYHCVRITGDNPLHDYQWAQEFGGGVFNVKQGSLLNEGLQLFIDWSLLQLQVRKAL